MPINQDTSTSGRAVRLLQAADGQISELASVLAAAGEAALRLACPGREKLGDGTVAACVAHTAGRYLLIAQFLQGADREGMNEGDSAADEVDLDGLLARLSTAREAFGVLAGLTDEALATVPPAGSFRFCDGQRTLEQVGAALLKHQEHQVDAIRAAVA